MKTEEQQQSGISKLSVIMLILQVIVIAFWYSEARWMRITLRDCYHATTNSVNRITRIDSTLAQQRGLNDQIIPALNDLLGDLASRRAATNLTTEPLPPVE